MAIVPMPLAPPCTSSVSPGCSAADWNTLECTVQATSGRPAASDRLTPAGSGSNCPAGTDTFSAYPPPPSSAHTWSPTAQPSTPSASAVMRPEHSSPGYGGEPGGGGY